MVQLIKISYLSIKHPYIYLYGALKYVFKFSLTIHNVWDLQDQCYYINPYDLSWAWDNSGVLLSERRKRAFQANQVSGAKAQS